MKINFLKTFGLLALPVLLVGAALLVPGVSKAAAYAGNGVAWAGSGDYDYNNNYYGNGISNILNRLSDDYDGYFNYDYDGYYRNYNYDNDGYWRGYNYNYDYDDYYNGCDWMKY